MKYILKIVRGFDTLLIVDSGFITMFFVMKNPFSYSILSISFLVFLEATVSTLAMLYLKYGGHVFISTLQNAFALILPAPSMSH